MFNMNGDKSCDFQKFQVILHEGLATGLQYCS